MIIFTLRDLGKGFFPWNLNNKNDVVGHRDPSGELCVVFADGTVTVLPPEIASAQDISDDGIVLGTLASAQRFDTRHQHVRWILWEDSSASWTYYLSNGTTRKLDSPVGPSFQPFA